MTERLHVCIEGYVQGVGFRFTTCHEAQTRGLTGWVRNLSDGRVEAEFEGAHDDLERMLEWCRQGPRSASVTHVDASWESGPAQYESFGLRW